MFHDQISKYYDSLTPSFRKVADFILNHTLEAAFMTATELGHRVGVDAATVIRFSQNIGYSGYRELSHEVQHYVRDQVTFHYHEAAQAKSEAELLLSLQEGLQQNLKYFSTTETANLAAAVKTINEASRVWLSGELSSYPMVQNLAISLKITGIDTSTFQPDIISITQAVTTMKEGDALLVLAGESPDIDVGYAIKLAKDKGVKTICVTSVRSLLPAREADIVVYYSSHTAGMVGYSLLYAILGMIWEAVSALRNERTVAIATEMYDNLSTLLEYRANSKDYEIT